MSMRNSYGLSQLSITKRILGRKLHSLNVDVELVDVVVNVCTTYRIRVNAAVWVEVTIYNDGDVESHALIIGKNPCMYATGLHNVINSIKHIMSNTCCIDGEWFV